MKDFKMYLKETAREVETIEATEALLHHNRPDVCFVDLRDGFELVEFGLIPGAEHCPRGSLEFRIPVDSPFHRPVFASGKRFVFYCSHGQRSILATRTAKQMGLEKVCHIRGGMKAWVEAGGEVARLTGGAGEQKA